MRSPQSASSFAKELRENSVGVLTLVAVGLLIYGLVKLSTNAAAATSKAITHAPATDFGAADQHLFAAVYTTTGGDTSMLGLNNSQNHPITAQVTLYNKHGAALAVRPITLDGHKNHAFNIADWVHSAGGGFEEGSLEVFYHDGSMALGAQETITDANHSLSFDVHLQEPMDFMSSRADGLWWGLGDNHAEAEVFIANTRSTQTTVTPTFYAGGVAHQGEAITLNGHESDVIDIEKSLKKLHLSTTAIGGITLNNATAGGLAMVGVIRNKQTGFSTTMRFIDQASQHTTTLHGADIPIGKPGPNSGFSAATRFTPHAFVRNNTSQPVTIHPRVRYTLFDQPNTVTLAAATLLANEVRELDLSPAITAIGNNVPSDTGIEIDHNGSPGAVMAYAASIDQNGSNVFDVPVKDPKSEMGFKGGSYPWNIAGDNRAVLHIKSIDAPTDGLKRQAMAKLYFDGGEYNIPLQQMEAGQTIEVDIKKLRDDQGKDILGNLIPLNVTGGQLAWYGRANKGEFIGRLVEYNPVTGVSSSFSCVQNCLCDPGFFNGLLRPEILLGFSNVAIGPIDAVEIDADCNQANFFTNGISDFGLFSANPDVATVSGHMVTLVAPGTTEITATWDAVTVQQHCIGLASDGECVDATCPTNNVATPAQTEVTVDTLRAIVPNAPVSESNGSPGIVANQSFQIVLQAVDASGNVDSANSSTIAVASSRTLDSSELGLSSTVTLSAGQYVASVRLNRVNATERGTTFRFSASGGEQVDLAIYTYFQVTATLEGLVGGTTACGHVITSADHFVALPSTGLCNTEIVVRNAASPLAVDSTTVREVGPWFPNTPGPGNSNPCSGGNDSYWNTGGVPRVLSTTCDTNNAAIDLANGTASTISISGLGSVLWRFD
jgi:hypothetical protein